MRTVLLILLGLAAIVVLALLVVQLKRRSEAAKLAVVWTALGERAPRAEIFEPEMISGLPEPARRYLLRATQPGTPLALGAELEMRGTFRLSPEAAWMPFTAEQRIAPPRGFVWRAKVGEGLVRFSGTDHHFEGRGAVDFWMWGAFPVARDSSPHVARSSLGRLIAESVLVPSSLLPQRGAAWEAVDENCARVTLEADPERHSLTLCVGDNGDLSRLWLKRWGNPTESGEHAWFSFGGHFEESREFGGYRIPTRFGVGWHFGEENYFEFVRAEIRSAKFF